MNYTTLVSPVNQDALQILLPPALAFSCHLFFSRSVLFRRHILRMIADAGFLLACVAFSVWVISCPLILLGPTSYDWFREYLSSKYAVEIKGQSTLRDLPQPAPIVDDQPVPGGLAVKYLIFGERSVDYSAMND